ncbi:MAG: methyltransferase domain-containing protein [Solirubrobacteraceae bacterium]|jgi:2-polyprenyl-3-methyl-5-hydroxy-6-metoxy-1,4-benzoquinol methylase
MSDQMLDDPTKRPEVPERFDPDSMHGEIIEAEHLARYRWAAPLAAGRRVLDAGCGAAYGTILLAEAGALEVVGVDRASEVLDSVRTQMPSNVVLNEGDVTALPYENGRFDLVVCFEVIEHLDDPGRALDEFRRVLTPEGVLAVSSPNREVYPPGNPHHVHEYTPGELEQELADRFSFVRLERQHTWITSAVLNDGGFQISGDGDLGTDVSVRKLAADEPGAELYTVALAGQQELARTAATFELATPVELRKWDALWHEQNQRLGDQAETLTQQAEMLTQQAETLGQQADLLSDHEHLFAAEAAQKGQLLDEISELREQLAKTESELARMPGLDAQLQELLQLNDELLQLNHELHLRQENLDALMEIAARYTVVVESSSWRLTRPLRQAAALARKLTR